MKHLDLDEKASTKNRIALRINRPTDAEFEKWFQCRLDAKPELKAFRPELFGSRLLIDVTTLSRVADAF